MPGYLIHSAIDHYAAATPSQAAVTCNGESLDYRQLSIQSNQLAHALLQNGAQHQDRVAIYMHKSLEMAIAIYGILKAGCIFVPIDPFIPAERLAFILEDCEVQHIVSSDALAPNIPSHTTGLPRTMYGVGGQDTDSQRVAWTDVYAMPKQPPDSSLIDQDLGYIMYTSGSTGVPKGMTHSHHGSLSYARWGAGHVAMTAADRVASHAPLHFDLSIFDFFSTAQAGATVVLIPEAVTRFPASWTKCIESERISVVFTVPFTLISMLEQGAMSQRDLSSLRWILYGGEPFPAHKLRSLMLELPDVEFTNVYGPAEAPSCTCYRVPIPEPGDDEPIPIGTVSVNSEDLIIDEHDQDCEPGQAGELCIRSSTLTHGYWNRPDLNAAAYLERPGPAHFAKVYFRTGDIVRRDTNGLLHFLGRRDRMVKIRGQRVELDEVEAVLASHSAVFEVGVFTVPDGLDSQQILASATLKQGHACEPEELLAHAKSRLPVYAVPTAIRIETSLPHNSSGKIDRKQLAQRWSESQG